jgi:hypothetical protein
MKRFQEKRINNNILARTIIEIANVQLDFIGIATVLPPTTAAVMTIVVIPIIIVVIIMT